MMNRKQCILAVLVVVFLLGRVQQLALAQGTFSSATLGAGNFDTAVGLNASKTYFNAVNTGGGGATVNGVSFAGPGAVANPSAATYSTTFFGDFTSGGTNSVTGNLGTVLNDFNYSNPTNPQSLTLTGLTTGQTYVLSFYNRGWVTGFNRTQSITTTSGASTSFNADAGTAGQGNVLRYTFQATGTNETVTFTRTGSGSFHLYGFSTEQVFNKTWTGGANWSTATWSPAGTPNAQGANAILPTQGSPTSISLDVPVTLGHLQLNGANAWTVSGPSTLTLLPDVGGVSVLSTPTGSHTISAQIAGSAPVVKLGAGTLILSGNNSTLTGDVAVNGGVLRGSTANAFGAASNTRSITVNSGATVEFNQVGVYGGHGSTNVPDLIINGGTVSNTFGNNPLNNVTLNGGTLTASASNTNTWRSWNINGTITSTGTSSINGGTAPNPGILLSSPGTNTNIDVQNGTLTISTFVGNGRNLSGPYAEHATSLTKQGAGTLILSGTNTYSGGTTISAGGGTLQIGGSGSLGSGTYAGAISIGSGGTFQYSSSAAQTLSGNITGAGALTKDTSTTSTLTLSGTNISYTGATTINAGTLTLGWAGSTLGGSIMSSSSITMSQGTTLNFNPVAQSNAGNSGTNAYTFGGPINLSGTAGTATMTFAKNDTKYSLSGNVTGAAGVAQTLAIVQGGSNTSAGDRQNILFSGVIANGGSGGTLGLSINFAGASGTGQTAFVNLSGQNTFTGPITVTNSKGLTGGAYVTIGGEKWSASHGGGAQGSGYLGGGNYSNTISLAPGVILNYFSSANQTLGGQISGGGSILKEGSGTLTLSGTNTYTGNTTVSDGVLEIGGSGTLGGGNYAGDISITNSASISFKYNSTASQTFSGKVYSSLQGNTHLTVSAGTLTLSGTTDNSFLIASVTGGQLDLAKSVGGVRAVAGLSNVSTGALVKLTGNGGDQIFGGSSAATFGINNLSGTVDLNGRSESVSNFNGSSTGVVDNTAAGAVTFTIGEANATNQTFAGTIKNSGGALSLTKIGTGTLTLSGPSTYTGGTNINAGTLRMGASSTSATAGPLGSAIIAPVVLADVGGAVLDINGFNVIAKELQGGGALGGNVTLNGGTLTINNPAFSSFYSGVISGAGNVVVNGTSGQNFSGANTYTGTTTINNSVTLGLNHVNALGTNPGVSGTSEIIFNNTGQLRPRIDGVIINAPITVNAGATAQIQAPDNNPGAGIPTTLTLNGAIGGPGNVSFISRLNANALNTVFLGASSNYAGTTLLDTSGGPAAQIIVKLGATNALPTTTVVTIDGQNGAGSGRFAEINLNGFNQTLAGLTNVARTDRIQRVVNSDVSSAATLTIDGSTNTTFSGNLGSNSPNGSVSATAMPGSTNGNNFGLTKLGSGTFTLGGANTYTGTTNVSDGELIVNGTHTGGGLYTVASGARLGGDGTIGANILVSSAHGELSPGDKGSLPSGPFPSGSSPASFSYSSGTDIQTIGSLDVVGNVNLGGYLLLDIMSLDQDLLNIDGQFTIDTNQYAQLEINGTTTLSEIDFWSILGWTTAGQSLDLVTFDGFGGGVFANVAFNQYFDDASGRQVMLGLDGDSIFIASTPEPASVVLWVIVGVALLAAGYYGRRQK